MKNRFHGKDSAVSEVIGYILIFSIVIVVGSSAFTLYIETTATNNEVAYQTGSMQALEYLDSSMFKITTGVGSQVYTSIPMGIQGSFLSQNTPTTFTTSHADSYSLSYQLGLSIQVQGYNPKLTSAPDKVIGTINLGGNSPDGLVYDSSNGYMYAITYSSPYSSHQGQIFVIVGNLTLGVTLPSHPYGVTFDSGDNTLILSMYNDSLTHHGQLIAIKPFALNYVYSHAQVIRKIQPPNQFLTDVAYDPSTGDVVVGSGIYTSGGKQYGGLDVFNASTFITSRAPVTVSADVSGTIPSSLTFDSANGLIYVAGGKYVWGVNSVTYAISNLYGFSGLTSPWGVAFDSFNGNLYVTAQTVSGQSSLGGLGLITPGGTTYSNVFVFNGTTNKHIYTYSNVPKPTGVIYDPANRHVYVTSYSTNKAYVFNGADSTQPVLKTLSVGQSPGGGFNPIVYDPVNHNVYVCNMGSGTISVIQGNTVLSSGWSIVGSQLPLSTTLNGSGSVSVTGYTSFVNPQSYSIEDGTVFQTGSSGVGENLNNLPLAFNTTSGNGRGLTMNSLDIHGGSNVSRSTTSDLSVTMTLNSKRSLSLTSGQIVTLVNGTQTLTAEILNVFLVGFSYTFTGPSYKSWEYSFYKEYVNNSATVTSFSSLPSSWTFGSLYPIKVSVTGESVTLSHGSSGTPISLNSISLNYYSFGMQVSG